MNPPRSPFFLVYGRDARLPTESTPPSHYLVDSEDYKVELAGGLARLHGRRLRGLSRGRRSSIIRGRSQ